jgi:hypothetical protein
MSSRRGALETRDDAFEVLKCLLLPYKEVGEPNLRRLVFRSPQNKRGSGLGKLWARKGHEVFVTSSRDRAKLEATATEVGAHAKEVK